jgi:ABC-type sugar transport system permease subunit
LRRPHWPAQAKEQSVDRTKERLTLFLWTAPVIALVLIFVIYPLGSMIVSSFSKLSFAGLYKGWAGWANYEAVLADPALPTIARNTVTWTGGVVLGTVLVSIGAALVLNEAFPGRRVVRWILVIPWATSLIITSLVFAWIFDSRLGTINVLGMNFGILQKQIAFLGQGGTAMPILILVGIFVSVPFATYVLLSGLQGISQDLYEAAAIDGAGVLRRFWTITLPMLRPFIGLATLLNAIYAFNSFPIIWLMTKGGPVNDTQTLITYMYKLAFANDQTAKAAALGTGGLLILFVLGSLYWITLRRSNRNA